MSSFFSPRQVDFFLGLDKGPKGKAMCVCVQVGLGYCGGGRVEERKYRALQQKYSMSCDALVMDPPGKEGSVKSTPPRTLNSYSYSTFSYDPFFYLS